MFYGRYRFCIPTWVQHFVTEIFYVRFELCLAGEYFYFYFLGSGVLRLFPFKFHAI
jgi:hypothetical protein